MRSLKAPNVISFALLKTTFFILMAGFCGLHHPAPFPEKPVVGQHAPSLGVENWLRGQSGISRDPSLAFWAGRVVIVQIHTGEEGGPLVSLMSEIGVAGADRLLRRYPPGRRVDVRYQPGEPTVAYVPVSNPQAEPRNIAWYFAAAAGVLLALALMALWRRERRVRQERQSKA